MQIPVVNLKQTGQNIYALREQSGISVRELQYLRKRFIQTRVKRFLNHKALAPVHGCKR